MPKSTGENEAGNYEIQAKRGGNVDEMTEMSANRSHIKNTTTAPSESSSSPLFTFQQIANEASSISSSFALKDRQQSGARKNNDVKSPRKVESSCVEVVDDESKSDVDVESDVCLSNMIEINTGDENEEVLFCERSKLFRFVEGEFKERGIGELKILRNKTNAKRRIVFRCENLMDEILKGQFMDFNPEFLANNLAANHWILPLMKIAPMQNNDKAFVWKAVDYADLHIKAETFAAKFKTPEIAQIFCNCFKECVKSMEECDSMEKENVKSEAIFENLIEKRGEKPAGFSDEFRAKPGSWECKGCSICNEQNVMICPCCETLKNGEPWKIDKTLMPDAKCDVYPRSAPMRSLFNFDSKSSGKNVTNDLIFAAPEPESKGNFVGNSNEIENYESEAQFEPVVPLPDLIELSTGENDEQAIFCERSKVYRWIEGEFKERGIGDLKILRHKVTNKHRIILRREQVHNLAMNHVITEEMNITRMKNNDKVCVWMANDFSQQQIEMMTFAARFKTSEIATHFAEIFEEAKEAKRISSTKNSVENKDDAKLDADSE